MTNRRRSRWALSGLVSGAVAASLALGALGLDELASRAWGQPPAAPGKGGGRAGRRARAANANAKANADAPPRRKAVNAADPLAKNAGAAFVKNAPSGSFHYRLKFVAPDDSPLALNYYPGKLDTTTPVVLLVHEKERSSKDFEEPIADLKGQGYAEHLQGLGYAVAALDLRGHGANARRPLTPQAWQEMVGDLQAVYDFLIDRHNRGELNLAKLGVVAVGEGANLAAAWADTPGGAVSSEGRTTDLAALALVSPLGVAEGMSLSAVTPTLAPRVALLLLAGERDAPSHDAVKAVRAAVEKVRQNKVEVFPSSLHGYKLLRLEPGATGALDRFFDATIKSKATDWEPRYNLTPTPYSDIEVVRHVKPADRAPEKEKEKAKDAAAKDAAAQDKDAPDPQPKPNR